MIVLIFTYGANCDECAYLLLNADPVEHGGQWDCVECIWD